MSVDSNGIESKYEAADGDTKESIKDICAADGGTLHFGGFQRSSAVFDGHLEVDPRCSQQSATDTKKFHWTEVKCEPMTDIESMVLETQSLHITDDNTAENGAPDTGESAGNTASGSNPCIALDGEDGGGDGGAMQTNETCVGKW